ncbi:MAG: TonB-dependent receptor [Acidobacteria bacterium]|nr:TonB-dependent receptor [Acidobacteriota bacterium]
MELRDEIKKILADAGVPFTEEQERAIALMMEDRKKASEDLFGQLMDFRSGPVQGQQQDRAVAAIQWMQTEFKKSLREYLTPEQLAAWSRHEETKPSQAATGAASVPSTAGQETRTQLIRINNNSFTAESPWFGTNRPQTEVIERGGTGAFHGNFSFEFKDESLNARNPFAHNKPPYQERQINLNVSGPLMANRLSASFRASQNEMENVDTVHAITPDGPFDLGIVRPFVDRNAGGSGTFQINNAHSLIFNGGFTRSVRKNQGVGGFSLPERASNGKGRWSDFQIRQFSVFSDRTLYETRFGHWSGHDEFVPVKEAVSIDVLDSFRGGGSQNKWVDDRDNWWIGNLFTRMGQKLTIKAGFDGNYLTLRSVNESNFLGAFTFSNMESYFRGEPASHRVTRGNPILKTSQFENAIFIQNDLKISQRLTLMFGARYDYQSNFDDRNNLAPRLAFAYAAGKTTVIRGGAGMYYGRYWDWIAQQQQRLDGTRQYEVVVQNPSYPDPFQSGEVTVIPPSSLRVTDPDLIAPYELISNVVVERTFRNNLFISVKYERNQSVHQFRSRDLNAPLPGQTTKPDPSRGNIWNLESTGLFRAQFLNVNFRQRFSIFNISGGYTLNSWKSDNDGPFGLPSNNYDLRSDWGNIGVPRHTFNSTVNAKLFWGIFLTNSINANSGGYYNITTGSDDNGDSNFNDRPPGTPRNSGDGPRFISFNFNISKALFIGPKPSSGTQPNVNLFANMTNAFNRTNYGTPSGVMTSPFFGKSFNARPPRDIRVGLRFQF